MDIKQILKALEGKVIIDETDFKNYCPRVVSQYDKEALFQETKTI